LVHPTLVKFPALTPYMTKLGGVLACAENAEWVLEREGLLGVYPEGIQGAFTFYRHAYKLGRFGRGEFVKMALRHRAPLVPFVTVGSAEIYPIFGRIDWKWWKRLSEWPFLPITPTLGLVPLPSKWHTWFLEPMHVEREYPPEAADDPAVVRAISRRVRRRMEAAIAEMLRRRKSIFYGSIFDREPDSAPAPATDAVPEAVLPDVAVRRSAPGELK
jgi:1-acyl-sn-glycerol-3-phosphate acyltransferase